MKYTIITLMSLLFLTGCTTTNDAVINNDSIKSNETTELSNTGFDSIDKDNIIVNGSNEADFLYNPYSIEDLLTKFYSPQEVTVMKAKFNSKDDSILTDEGSVLTSYDVTIEEVYNSPGNIDSGQSLTLLNSGGCVTVNEYKPYINKEKWLESIKDKSDEWLNSNYYCEQSFAQTQSIEQGDEFLVMFTETTYGNMILFGNGLMEISGDELINNDDTTQNDLKYQEVIEEINQIYN